MPTPDSMRAWRVTRLGEPVDALSLDVLATPTPGPGEVQVRVRAVAVNFPDVLLCRGDYQVKPELPFVPGIELVGDVVALGEGVSGFAPGARVLGSKIEDAPEALAALSSGTTVGRVVIQVVP